MRVHCTANDLSTPVLGKVVEPPLEMSPKKVSGRQPAEKGRWIRPWELGDEWEIPPTSKPTYQVWNAGFSLARLEETLDSLRQSQLWLSNSLRLLAESVNDDQHGWDARLHQVKECVQSMDWRLLALEDKVAKLQAEQTEAQGMRDAQITARLDAFHVRLLALEGVQQLHGTTHEPAAAELRRDICNQLLCMATVLNNSELDEPAVSPLEERIRAAQQVAAALRSPGRSVGNSRVPSPAPSARERALPSTPPSVRS